MSASGTYLSVTRLSLSPSLSPSLSFSLSPSLPPPPLSPLLPFLVSGLSPLLLSAITPSPRVRKDCGRGAAQRRLRLRPLGWKSGGGGGGGGASPVEGCSVGVMKLPVTSGRTRVVVVGGGISRKRPLGGSMKQAFSALIELVGVCTVCVGASSEDNLYM